MINKTPRLFNNVIIIPYSKIWIAKSIPFHHFFYWKNTRGLKDGGVSKIRIMIVLEFLFYFDRFKISYCYFSSLNCVIKCFFNEILSFMCQSSVHSAIIIEIQKLHSNWGSKQRIMFVYWWQKLPILSSLFIITIQRLSMQPVFCYRRSS